MICSSEKRFFTSNLRLVGDWTPNRPATQRWGDVAGRTITARQAPSSLRRSRLAQSTPRELAVP
ncbi:hypothetical protein CSC68_14500 [Pseudoxanthomonas suwonensis]|nr:hypothetical protein CSC68_14500 [Pseudoxanthomonas suwonensis]